MSSPTIISPGESALAVTTRRWHWPPYPLTLVVAGIVLLAAFFANFPAVDTRHVSLAERFGLTREYEHGWPLRFVTHDGGQPSMILPPTNPPVWRPWHDLKTFSAANLIIDLAIWTTALMLAAIGTQYWRSRRRTIWQLKIADLFGLVTIAAVLCGWIAAERLEIARERRHIAIAKRASMPQLAAAVPAFLPEAQQATYRSLFERVASFDSYGQTEMASEFSHLLILREQAPAPELRKHLALMPQLEALDLWRARLPYLDATRQATILRDLPVMPRLRGIYLAESTATDMDMAWLAKCQRLEAINVSDAAVGDEGIRHLRALPRLRVLTLSRTRITDEGCRRLATFPALEELSLNSRNIHDVGVLELARLKKLRLLKINAAASAETFAKLQQALPDCKIHEHSLR